MSFVEVTGDKYTQLLIWRLSSDAPELTWIKQCRDILTPHLYPGITLLDIGCATGYAYKSFRQYDVNYTGIDIEPKYLDIATRWFYGQSARFIHHDIEIARPPVNADVVICGATLEHCSTLMPALDNILSSANHFLLLRTMLGDFEDIYSIPSPVNKYRKIWCKHTNQYSVNNVLDYIESQGFKTTLFNDEYTQSRQKEIDSTLRKFLVVFAEK